jgi:hypothetical protein
VLDQEGLSFSPEKLRVLEFPLPSTKGALKKFLGLANYFRDHIQGHSSVVAPLQKYLGDYTKRYALHAIALDAEARDAFETVKEMIQNCPKLFFLNDTDEIIVYTDASNYGAGGYVTQLVTDDSGNKREVPIQFFSQSYTKSQLNWKFPQKEAYAMYATLFKFDYVIVRPVQVAAENKNQKWNGHSIFGFWFSSLVVPSGVKKQKSKENSLYSFFFRIQENRYSYFCHFLLHFLLHSLYP